MEPKITDAPFIYFIKSFIKRYVDDDIGALASEASYCFILGLIPFLIFLVNCILFFAAPQLDTIMNFLMYLPEQFATSMEENVARIVEGRSSLWLPRALPFSSAGWITYFFKTEIYNPGLK